MEPGTLSLVLFVYAKLDMEHEDEFFVHNRFCPFLLSSFDLFQLHVSEVANQLAGALLILDLVGVVQYLAARVKIVDVDLVRQD